MHHQAALADNRGTHKETSRLASRDQGRGKVADYAELARLGRVTRSRMSQSINRLCLAPDIQEEFLFLPAATQSRDIVTKRQLRVVVVEVDWVRQTEMWRRMVREHSRLHQSRKAYLSFPGDSELLVEQLSARGRRC